MTCASHLLWLTSPHHRVRSSDVCAVPDPGARGCPLGPSDGRGQARHTGPAWAGSVVAGWDAAGPRGWPSGSCRRTLAVGTGPPAGRAEQSLRVTLPVPRTRLPAETQGGAPELLLRPRVCPARPLLWAGGGHGRACPEGAGGGGREPFGFYQLLGLWRDKGQVASRGEGGPGGRPGLKPVPRWGRAGMQPDLVWSPARP